MTLPETLGVVTAILSIAAVIVGVTRYITQLQFQVRLERLKAETEASTKAQSDLKAVNSLLIEELNAAKKTGALAASKKGEIDDALAALIRTTAASAGSVYVPLPEDHFGRSAGLVFLSIQPVTQQTMKLRKKVIPLESLAGRAFTRGEGFVVGNSRGSTDHYEQADKVSGFQTDDTLNVPLRSDGRTVGVLQLLNRHGAQFAERDLDGVTKQSRTMAARVEEFLGMPESLEFLGLVQQPDGEQASVMFCDLTSSSTLFSTLNVSSAIQHLNEYLERTCDVAFRHGATVDKYVGDGVLLRFNVPRAVDDHARQAVLAAFEITDAFSSVKREWMTMGEVLGDLYVRTGIATGPVQRATVGHPQYQYLTIFGMPVNAAVNLCEVAARDRNVVVVDATLYEQVADMVDATMLPEQKLGKARKYTRAAYEVRPRSAGDSRSTLLRR